jgi:hypothetical protein
MIAFRHMPNLKPQSIRRLARCGHVQPGALDPVTFGAPFEEGDEYRYSTGDRDSRPTGLNL